MGSLNTVLLPPSHLCLTFCSSVCLTFVSLNRRLPGTTKDEDTCQLNLRMLNAAGHRVHGPRMEQHQLSMVTLAQHSAAEAEVLLSLHCC